MRRIQLATQKALARDRFYWIAGFSTFVTCGNLAPTHAAMANSMLFERVL